MNQDQNHKALPESPLPGRVRKKNLHTGVLYATGDPMGGTDPTPYPPPGTPPPGRVQSVATRDDSVGSVGQSVQFSDSQSVIVFNWHCVELTHNGP